MGINAGFTAVQAARNCRGSCLPIMTSSPPYRQIKCEKKPVLSYELFFKYGGEGFRTPDTLPYTLSCSFSHSDTSPKLFCCLTSWGNGRYYRELE
ncbi:hypothetical protein DMI70_18990 [Escherichia coli]|nr:hypothetical protein [Escherichia coli]